jgi:hypothetical protein
VDVCNLETKDDIPSSGAEKRIAHLTDFNDEVTQHDDYDDFEYNDYI